MKVLQQLVIDAMLQVPQRARERRVSRRLHRAVLEGVRKGDAQAAERAMREHVALTRNRLLAGAG
jgi:DNA-binding FadR family transcriptional regulator